MIGAGARRLIARVQRAWLYQFAVKVAEDRWFDLAVLLAWGTLSTLLPVLLGVFALAGLVLRDPRRLGVVQAAVLAAFPSEVAGLLGNVLDDTVRSASVIGVVGLALLVWSGSNWFVTMQGVFDLAYHVPDRDFVRQRLLAFASLVVVTALLLVSTAAFGAAQVVGGAWDELLRHLPFELLAWLRLAAVLGWLVSLVSALATFLWLFTILPNTRTSWRHALPGAILTTILFFVTLEVFPLYVRFFGGSFHAYAAFGAFLLMMFWAYLLGVEVVLGIELNAFRAVRRNGGPSDPHVPVQTNASRSAAGHSTGAG